MEEKDKSKKKKIIKKAAIIFVVVLLLLTFFSNTILNYTLPEVSSKTVVSGTVSTAVIGQGNVENDKDYIIKAKGNRTVDKIYVKKDDKVKKGDLLFTYKEGSDTDLEEAKTALEELEISHAKKLLEDSKVSDTDSGIDLDKDRKELNQARKDLEKVEEYKEELDSKKSKQKKLNKEIEDIKKKQKKNDDAINALGTVDSVETLQAEITSSENSLADLNQQLADLKEDYQTAKNNGESADSLKTTERSIRDKEKEISKTTQEIADKKVKLSNLITANSKYKELNDEKKELEEKLTKKTDELTKLSTKISELETKADVKSAKEKVESAEEKLKSDTKSITNSNKNKAIDEKLEDYDDKKALNELEEARKKVKSLTTDDLVKVYSKQKGIVDTINLKEGQKVEKDSELITITGGKSEYVVKFATNKELAKKINKNSEVRIEEDWEGNMKAKVKSIVPDPSNPAENTLITVKVKGKSVTPGDVYNINIGGTSKKYDAVISNNTIKEDTNGKFVYVINVKSTPIGNRYSVKKVPIEVLATDGNKSAISGEITESSNIVGNSSKPLEDGMQVKLADS